ncbi:putative metallophosphoesterase YhaO [Moorella thermoacetica]|uniref:Nuclease SbcCD subunit D n=1 Tax=Neomoorella thermoacetica TaxID=1525 RepID=A0A1J5NR34_NEOTH|nr:putative metallophosphoesterase YhaO [Moorella thermoacetica]
MSRIWIPRGELFPLVQVLIWHQVLFSGGDSMIRFLHTADWQVGMKARHVAPVAARVREARLETARRLMEITRERRLDFIIIAGDVFEDNQVDNKLAHQVVQILSLAAPVPVYILPGNHDPLTPDAVYERRVFREGLAPNIHLLRTSQPVTVLPGVVLLPAPNRAKNSPEDPTERMAPAPGGAINIGVAHGSLRIEGHYQYDDFPIPLEAAERRGLDYLALGHWHSFFQYGDRTFYPGTPEPTGFEERDSGTAALVTIEGYGARPRVEKIKTGTLEWETWKQEVHGDPREAVRALKLRVEGLDTPGQTLLRLALYGRDTSGDQSWLEELRDWLEARLLYLDLDTTRLATQPLAPKLQNRARSQPFLRAAITDLAALARSLGQPLEEVEDVAGPATSLDAELIDRILRAGIKPGDVREALGVLAGVVEEV